LLWWKFVHSFLVLIPYQIHISPTFGEQEHITLACVEYSLNPLVLVDSVEGFIRFDVLAFQLFQFLPRAQRFLEVSDTLI
jgi:hypothetical protein